MRRKNELENRLREWAEEYRQRDDNHGWQGISPTAILVKWGGRPPDGQSQPEHATPADEVEQAVQALEKQKDGYRAAMVLRCEYAMERCAESHKRQKLSRIGLPMSRATFYDELWVARVHVAAWLRIPSSVELPEDICEERACV